MKRKLASVKSVFLSTRVLHKLVVLGCSFWKVHSEVIFLIDNFKKFIVSSNVLDWAIGIVVGTAFGKIVYSFINDIVMPPIGLFLGKVDFRDLFINLSHKHYSSLPQAQQAGAPTINYGIFLSSIIDFLVLSFVVYAVVTQLTKWYSEPMKECPYCTSLIPTRAVRCPKCTSRLDE